jgi:hypothetical protein
MTARIASAITAVLLFPVWLMSLTIKDQPTTD